MTDISYLIANLDAILGENMFLKDARKADALKGSIHTIFCEVDKRLDSLETQLSYTTNQTFSDMEDLNKVKDALKDYLKNQIDLNKQLLSNLGEWY